MMDFPIAEAEKEGPDIRAVVSEMYSGNQYYLFCFKRIKDIRIVYAPPRSLGNFGGDIDNWMWPRHTCDFTFLRAYVSPDNIGVDHSPDNVPYRPKSYLKISLEGFQKRDFSFVMGYPGRTYRNHTIAELNLDLDNMKKRLDLYADVINFFEEAGKDNRKVQIKYAGIIKGLNNGLKNYQGKLEGVKKTGLLSKKMAAEKNFQEWVNKNPERREKFGSVLSGIENFMDKYKEFATRNRLIGQVTSAYLGSSLLSQAYTVYRTATERQKPDMEREPAYQERNLPYIKMRIQLAERSYDPDVDRAFLKHQLKKLFDYPLESIPPRLKILFLRNHPKPLIALLTTCMKRLR
ncbi:MAG: S46 family peptidase [Candidatus Aminicenantes bacterium]|nr:S46 family peptidase [Candidatus Aminicenantes bacterium]